MCDMYLSLGHAISKCFPYIIRYLHKPGCIDIALILTAKKSSPSTLSNNEMSIISSNNHSNENINTGVSREMIFQK